MAEQVTTRTKLIEVALPLDAINAASAREKSIRHGHPSTLHLWWARRPLAAARAVLFAQLVDDPSGYADELRADAALVQRARVEQERRRQAWLERTEEYASRRDGDPAVPAPGPEPSLDDCMVDLERERLFEIIRQLVPWENTTNEAVLQQARDEIWKSWRRTCAANRDHPRAAELFDPHRLPAFHDPFAGGGTIPLEAQRLGLEAHASDLNPVAVLINKAMIEIPPKFANRPPVNPEDRKKGMGARWKGAAGLAADVRYYGKWMRDEAEKRIGHLYPKVEITAEMAIERPDLKPLVGQKLTVIAWLWARTVKSPNPAFAQVDVPLVSTFMLSTKPGKEAYVEPVIENGGYRFTVKVGKPSDPEAAQGGTKLSRGANFRCVMSGTAMQGDYIKAEGRAGRMGARLMAIVAEGQRGRVYVAATSEHESVARQAQPTWRPTGEVPARLTGGTCVPYGLSEWGDLFTLRQLVALTTFSDLVQEVRERVKQDALAAGMADGECGLETGAIGAKAYGEAVGVILSLSVGRLADRSSSICSWDLRDGQGRKPGIRNVFSRQAIPMTWDFAEANPLSEIAASVLTAIGRLSDVLLRIPTTSINGVSIAIDAQSQDLSARKVVSTDPPYFDNVGYADLSDFFYVWLRQPLRPIFPTLFATLAVPKAQELVAISYRHGGKDKAEAFFLKGMTQAMHRLAEQAHAAFPLTIYYAFKQAETGNGGTVSSGWDTFLEAVIRAGLSLDGTWPIRTELGNRMIGSGTNALASSVVLVCRPLDEAAPTASRPQFVSALRTELPAALGHLQKANIAPVDLAQAAIGPGMAIYTRYKQVLDAEGKPLTVRQALALINEVLDEVLAEQEGDFDADTRWALAWFEEFGFNEGEYGRAELLSKAKNTSVAGMMDASILRSRGGKVRLLRPDELPADWDPATDTRLTVWETVHHLVRALDTGEAAAAALVAKLGARADVARELAYRLYVVCERKKRAPDALAYNGLVQSWPEIARLAQERADEVRPAQAGLFDAEPVGSRR